MAETYDPKQNTVVFAGIPIEGFAEDIYAASRNEDAFNLRVGATGRAARAQNANNSGRVTITLLQTSPSNARLAAQHALDQATGNGTGVLSIKDLSGADRVFAQEAWIVKHPDMENNNEVGQREWILESGNLVMTAGGNP
jgi:hypothetical protein